MSGSIGADRIPSSAVKSTVNSYVELVLKRYPGFKGVKITGSYNLIPKDEEGNVVKGQEKEGGHGDIDLVLTLEGNKEDIKEIKVNFAKYLQSFPDNIIAPFKAGRYQGKKTAGTGDIVITQFPINGHPGMFIQIDNMIVTSEKESDYRSNFLNIPGPKQALLLGLVRTICIEEDPYSLFKKLHIKNIPELKENQEYEFVLSPKGLTLRIVTLENFKEVERESIWESYNWEDVKVLLEGYKIDSTFEELLKQLSRRSWKSPRSKRRIKGLFKSMLIIGAGEKGTPKGDIKQKALKDVEALLEVKERIVSLYAGGFKPPHLAHFRNAKILSLESDKLIIFIGRKIREGILITPEQSKEVWKIYSKYLSIPVEVRISEVTPIRDIYEWIDQNQDNVNKILIGNMEGDDKRFSYIIKNREKYPKVKIKILPEVESIEGKFSASSIRSSARYLRKEDWIPKELSERDKKLIIKIMTKNTPTEKEINILEAIGDTVEEFLSSNPIKIEEGSSGTAIAPQGVQRSEDRSKLASLYSKLMNSLEGSSFKLTFENDRIVIRNKEESEKIGFDYTPYMGSLLEYMLEKKYKITPLPEIVLRKNFVESQDFFGKTGEYNPSEKKITLYVEGRHPKDVMRSFAHEMIHHKQNLEGRLLSVETADTNKDEDLKKLEEEAYSLGNITFRNWEDSVKVNSE